MPKPRKTGRTSIASRVKRSVAGFRQSKVVPLDAVRTGKAAARQLAGSVPAPEQYADLHPAHALYAVTVNHLSAITEVIAQLPELSKLSELIGRAEDEYMPGAPPMSPLTLSFFNMWALFDASVGMRRETLGTIARDVGADLGLHPEMIRMVSLCCESRMGLYVLEQSDADIVLLRELVTGRSLRCINPTGYVGKAGQVWYVRAMPPPAPQFTDHVLFTTPYDVTMPGEGGWTRFLDRALSKNTDRVKAYEALMKWGRSPNHWNEYVFCAYFSHQFEAIHLVGVPDVDASLPHSRVNSREPRPFEGYVASGKMARGELA